MASHPRQHRKHVESESSYSLEDIARVRAEIRAGNEERTRQAIRRMRAADRATPFREIARRAGVTRAYVEEVLGERAPPEGIRW